ncbi:MAG TPA: hypothetical protein VE404_04240 [Verrucomicrobiae bacterium]|nr:hypothetical protein [Verrucomicrobiae bacterium]
MARTVLARIGLCLVWLAISCTAPALAASPDGGAHPFVGDVGFRVDGLLISYAACHGVLVSDHVMVTSATCAAAVTGFLAGGPDHHVFVSFDEAPLDFQDPVNSFVSIVSAAADAPPPASKKDPTPLLGVLILDVAGAPPGVFIPGPAHLPAAGAVSGLPRRTPITTVTYRGTRMDIVSDLIKVSADQFTVDIMTDAASQFSEPCGKGPDSGAASFMPGTADVAAGVAIDADAQCRMQTVVARLDTARERAFFAGYGVPVP